MTSSQPDQQVRRLALSLLQPGFTGTRAPEWILRRIDEGLSSVVLFARNIVNPEQVAQLTAQLRAANPKLIIAIDEEAGDVTRIESWTGSSRPGNLALGTVDDVELTESVARDLGRELHAGGISLDYAPSVDVNSNPDNPVIGVRSFGAEPALVSRHAAAWVRGLQSAGVAGCAKHFPGHGDTVVDSHHGMPTYAADRDKIAEQALPPFRAALDAGVRAVMSAHVLVPAYDPEQPATLSRRILHQLLRDELGFTGMIVTDGIEMGAVSNAHGIEGATVRAVAAGADAVCVGGESAGPETVTRLVDALAEAVASGRLDRERLADAAARVRGFADWSAGLRRSVAPSVISGDIGYAAARRAVRLDGAAATALPLSAPPHVVELVPVTHLAIGPETPWGVAVPLRERVPGTTFVRIHQDDLREGDEGRDVPADRTTPLDRFALSPASGRPMVVVVRDAARHAWMHRALGQLVKARPDAIVVEMGLPGPVPEGSVLITTHGATAASGVAAAEILTGAAAPPH